MSIGSTIKRLRRENDVTQEQLAEYLGITSRAISQWECDRTAPDISLLPALCHIFGVSSDVLLGIDIERNNEEIKQSPDKFAEIQEVNYINTPIEYSECIEEFKSTDRGLAVLYDYILKEKKQVLKTVFDTIASANEGSILFHCTLGRDRTAMVAMLLLGLVGVNRNDIIQNYTVSYDLIKDLDIIKRDLISYGKRKTITLPEYIESALDFIKNDYNTFENYLIGCNISKNNLIKIKNRFIQ